MIRKHAWLLAFCAAVAACETPTESTTPDVTLEGVEPTASIVNIWATKASVLTYRRFAVAGAQNNIIYVVGGRDASGDATKTLQVYTIATNSWAFKADMPVNRSSAQRRQLPERPSLRVRRAEQHRRRHEDALLLQSEHQYLDEA